MSLETIQHQAGEDSISDATGVSSDNSPKSSSATLVADSDPEYIAESPKSDAVWTSFVPLLIIFAVFYFLLIRPQEQKRKEQETLISSVKKGEDVITTGGIFGKVVKVSDNEQSVILEIAEKVNIKILKSAILEITSRVKKEVKK
ncbi:MAG: preprotein translocase subunit YajC [Rickettsiaceae bacterium]|nr:preprotein translocase subunit YajC [Rickettsiaceae bacterium]